jgi:predicted secreted protein
MAILKGDQLQLFFEGATFAYATNHVLTLSTSTTDISSKDHGNWSANSASKVNWELTADNLYTDADYDTLWTLMLRRIPFEVKFGLVGNYSPNGLIITGGDVASWMIGAKYFRGQAVITNLQLNAATGENANYSVTLTGCGPLVNFDGGDVDTPSHVVAIYFNNTSTAKTIRLENANARSLYTKKMVGTEGSPVEYEGQSVSIPAKSGVSVEYTFPDGHIPAGLWNGTGNDLAVIMNANEGAVEVDEGAFAGNTALRAVDLRGVVIVGDEAFKGCTNLGRDLSVEGGDAVIHGGVYDSENTVMSIGAQAFYNTPYLTTIELSTSVMNIGSQAFYSSSRGMNTLKLKGSMPPTLAYAADALPFPETIQAIQVPSRAVFNYTSAAGWSNYSRIISGYTPTRLMSGGGQSSFYDPEYFNAEVELETETEEPTEP